MAGTAQAAADARRARDRWEYTKVRTLEPGTVKWLVDGSGYARAELARKMGVAPDVFERWVETGRMTHAVIKRLAVHLKRPPLTFFHKEPLREPVLADYRGGVSTGTGTGIGTAPALSPMDIVEVRLAWQRKSMAGEMIGDLEREGNGGGDGGGGGGGGSCNSNSNSNSSSRRSRAPLRATVGDDPCTVAAEAAVEMGLFGGRRRARQAALFTLGAEAAAEMGLTGGDGVRPPGFDALRDAVERHGDALVFQEPMDVRSVRVVALAGGAARAGPRAPKGAMVRGARDWDFPARSPHAILLNARDAEGTRSFSMMHGYGHILLGAGEDGWDGDGYVCKEGGGAMGGAATAAATAATTEEAWCDSFAAAVLMPPDRFAGDLERAERTASQGARRAGDAARMTAALLSRQYEASMYAAAVRAIDVHRRHQHQHQHQQQRPPNGMPWRYEALLREIENTAGTSHGRPAMWRASGRSRAEYCESRLGRRFVRIVLDAEASRLETLHDAIDMLGIRLDDFDRVGELAGGWPDPGAAA